MSLLGKKTECNEKSQGHKNDKTDGISFSFHGVHLLGRLPEKALQDGFTAQEIVKVMEITDRTWDIIFFLCDHFQHERPARKTKEKAVDEIRQEMEEIKSRIAMLSVRLDNLINPVP